MSLMDLLDDLVMGPMNVIDRIEGLLSGIRYGDLGHQFAIPRLDKGGNLSLNEVEEILNQYGIAVYGRTHDATNMYFLVKRRQAGWAEYILLHAGVQLVGPRVDPRNPGYVERHQAGWMPIPWSQNKSQQRLGAGEQVAEQANSQTVKHAVKWWNQF